MTSAAIPDAELSAAPLVEEAVTRAGWRHGEVPFTATLELLLSSCRSTGAVNATGRQVLRKAALRHLRNLCHIHGYVEDHAEVATHPLEAPIVVTGLPRTGTTLLHNLLALDPQHRALRLWEALQPAPPSPFGAPAEPAQAQAQAQA